MDDVNEFTEEPDASTAPAEPASPIQSRFLFVDVAALRAKQLRRGAHVRFDEADVAAPEVPRTPERLAMEEVRRGLVYYEVPDERPTQAEGDA